ncbi:GEVED domain-containing protein [Lysobacter enzymogenes]|uniref:GEVED domain-containing protein n=1 Tax=Lysobacter enzymogenes TaxID=69 RepID=UPI0019D17267|nr:GEVED domain-containing protein [Lysobacter enzymogenes]
MKAFQSLGWKSVRPAAVAMPSCLGKVAGAALLTLSCVLPQAAFAQACGNLITGEFGGTFGTISTNTRRNLQLPAAGGYTYGGGGVNSLIPESRYVVVSRNGSDDIHPTNVHWQTLFGHNAGGATDANDAYLAVNGSGASGVFFRQQVTLAANERYRLSVWGVNAVNELRGNPAVGVRILDSSGTIVTTASTGVLPARTGTPPDLDSPWREAAVQFNSGAGGTFFVETVNLSTASSGNDFAIDDIAVTQVDPNGCPRDFGDAPDTGSGTGRGNYQTLLADNGPRHVLVGGLFLGSSATVENDGQPNALANGDVDNGIAGALAQIVPTAGSAYSVNVGVSNTTGTAAILAGFIDFNRDGDFADSGERVQVTVPQRATSVALNFTVPAGAVPGPSILRLRLARDAADVATAFGPASSGEVEDYPVRIGPTLTRAKTWNGATVGHTATLTATGLADFVSTAQTPSETDTSTAQAVVVGSTIQLAETLGGGATAGMYGTSLACSGAADTNPADGLLIGDQDEDIVCTFTNARHLMDVRVSKTNTPASGPVDLPSDGVAVGGTTVYTIVASNAGPSAADGAIVRDSPDAALTCNQAQCTQVTGGAACPGGGAPPQTLAVATLLGTGLTIPTFPVDSSVTITLTCTVGHP